MAAYFVAADPETGEATLYEGTRDDLTHPVIRRGDFFTDAEFEAFCAGAKLP